MSTDWPRQPACALRGKLLTMTLSDDGRGFEPFAVVGDHMGLTIMGERASETGADLEISAELGAGTSIQVDLPSSAARLTAPSDRQEGR